MNRNYCYYSKVKVIKHITDFLVIIDGVYDNRGVVWYMRTCALWPASQVQNAIELI